MIPRSISDPGIPAHDGKGRHRYRARPVRKEKAKPQGPRFRLFVFMLPRQAFPAVFLLKGAVPRMGESLSFSCLLSRHAARFFPYRSVSGKAVERLPGFSGSKCRRAPVPRMLPGAAEWGAPALPSFQKCRVASAGYVERVCRSSLLPAMKRGNRRGAVFRAAALWWPCTGRSRL